MSITTQVEDEKELIESALKKFMYELGLADIRRRIPQAELSEEEVKAELQKMRRVKRETLQYTKRDLAALELDYK